MAAGLADSGAPTTGQTSLTDWIAKHGDSPRPHLRERTRPPLPLAAGLHGSRGGQ